MKNPRKHEGKCRAKTGHFCRPLTVHLQCVIVCMSKYMQDAWKVQCRNQTERSYTLWPLQNFRQTEEKQVRKTSWEHSCAQTVHQAPDVMTTEVWTKNRAVFSAQKERVSVCVHNNTAWASLGSLPHHPNGTSGSFSMKSLNGPHSTGAVMDSGLRRHRKSEKETEV